MGIHVFNIQNPSSSPAQATDNTPVPVTPASPEKAAGKGSSFFALRAKGEKGKWATLFSKTKSADAPQEEGFSAMKPINPLRKKGIPDLTKASNADIAYRVLNLSYDFTDSEWDGFCHNIMQVEGAEKSGNEKDIKAAKKAFKKAHEKLISPSDFDRLPVLIPLRNRIREKQEKASQPQTESEVPLMTVSLSEKDRLKNIFLEAINKVPRAPSEPVSTNPKAPESADYKNQFISSSSTSTEARIEPGKYGKRISNTGGGDCLFHALVGRNLSNKEIIEIRARIADVRRSLPSGEEAWNAHRLVAGLTQTPDFGVWGQTLMEGRHSISNEVLAAFQAVPGMYAGEEELSQWTLLPENRERTVLVIHREGPAEVYSDGKRHFISHEQHDDYVNSADLLLYKSARHWEQIARNNH